MTKTISSTELQKNTRQVIDWARTRGEAVVVETYGKPMAAILSYDEYQIYMAYKQSRAERASRFAQLRQVAAQNAAFNQLTEDEAVALADAARQEVHESQS